jgi:hypothetical protein
MIRKCSDSQIISLNPSMPSNPPHYYKCHSSNGDPDCYEHLSVMYDVHLALTNLSVHLIK